MPLILNDFDVDVALGWLLIDNFGLGFTISQANLGIRLKVFAHFWVRE